MPDRLPDEPDKLERLLGGVELEWLVSRVRRRMERGEPLAGQVTLANASGEQRAAVHRLLGRKPRPGSALSVSLDAVDRVVRDSGACREGLAAAVVALTGEVTDRARAAEQRARDWERAFAPLRDVVARREELADWYESLHATGLVRRLAGTSGEAEPLLADLAAVIAALPAGGEPLGRFAARTAGGAHALDDDCPLATLTLGAARALSGLPEGSGAEWRREVWAAVGLLRDELSSTVLTLGLPGDEDTATGRALAACTAAGEPAVLTLRQLIRTAPRLPLAGRTASVCENPVVVSAAADRLAAALRLLRALAGSGAALRYHGDFDWGGVRIGNVVFDRLPAVPWRFDTAAYRRAAAEHAGRPLTGTPVAARWDSELAAAMTSTARAVEEELVLEELLDDLAS